MKKKITSLTIVAVVLSLLLTTIIYFSFFSFNNLRKMGYNNRDLMHMMIYKLCDRVDSYNKCLVYSLNSSKFVEDNLEYYLLFTSEYDYTEYINCLASKYSLEEVKALQKVLSNDEMIDLSELDVISNVDNFVDLYKLGYDLENCITLVNTLDEESITSLLALKSIENPMYYIKYLEKGYDDVTITNLYNNSFDAYNDLVNMKYFEELSGLISNDEFNIVYLPRYLMYLENNDVSEYQAILAVNDGKDVVDDSDVEYSEYYVDEPNIVENITIDCLINKANKLKADVDETTLTTLDGIYRGNNQPVNKELANSFIELADYIRSETDISIIAYNGYENNQTVQETYDKYIKASNNNTNSVDGLSPKAFYSEHETGLAIDIAESGYSYNDLISSKIYTYLNQFASQYGFILRYPEDKEFITGYQYIPYHYRYVGLEIATICNKYNWTLEEYCYLFK